MFDFNRESPTALQSLFCLVTYLSVLILCYKDYYSCRWIRNDRRIKLYWYIIFMPVLYAMTNFVDTDFFHYYRFVSDLSHGVKDNTIEPVYHEIANLTFYNYLLFRFFIWGFAFVLVFQECLRLRLKTDFVFYTLFVLYINLFTYARASLGMAVAFFGITLILTSRNRLSVKLGGILILCSSVFFHSSMVFIIVCSLFAYLLKWSKRWIIFYLIAIPCLTVGLGKIMSYMLNLEGIEGLMFSKLLYYSELENINERTLIGEIHNTLEISSFVVPLIIIARQVYFKSIHSDISSIRSELYLFKIAFVIVAISIAFLFIGLRTEVFSYRIRYMAIIPIVLSLCGLTIKNVVKRGEYQLCLLIGSASILMSLFSAVKNS